MSKTVKTIIAKEGSVIARFAALCLLGVLISEIGHINHTASGIGSLLVLASVGGYGLYILLNLVVLTIQGGQALKLDRAVNISERDPAFSILPLRTLLWFIATGFLFRVAAAFDNPPLGITILLLASFLYLCHKSIMSLMNNLWEYLDVKRPQGTPARIPNKLTATLGTIDRTIYGICFAIHAYGFIGLWLSIKIASRLIQFRNVEISDDPRVMEKLRELGERKNVFLIGNIVSLILGICTGYLIIVLFDLPAPELIVRLFLNG